MGFENVFMFSEPVLVLALERVYERPEIRELDAMNTNLTRNSEVHERG